MALTLYELAGAEDGRCFSPFVWRIRLALAHKGLEAECVPVRFTEKEKIAFSGSKTFPVLVDGDKAIHDSWRIACHLEDAYPDLPSLFGGPVGLGLGFFVNEWAGRILTPLLVPMIVADVWRHLHEKDQDYFRTSREQRFGTTLEMVQSGRDQALPAFRAALEPVRAVTGEGAFLSGDSPAYADYIVFSFFQWARQMSEFRLLDDDDPVHAWRRRMLDLYDGLAGAALGYPV